MVVFFLFYFVRQNIYRSIISTNIQVQGVDGDGFEGNLSFRRDDKPGATDDIRFAFTSVEELETLSRNQEILRQKNATFYGAPPTTLSHACILLPMSTRRENDAPLTPFFRKTADWLLCAYWDGGYRVFGLGDFYTTQFSIVYFLSELSEYHA